MLALLFVIAIDWVMRRTTEDQRRDIRWTLFSTLEDLDFADDLALVSLAHQHTQEKTSRLSTFARQVGLKINQKKTEVMMLNVHNSSPVKVNGEDQGVDKGGGIYPPLEFILHAMMQRIFHFSSEMMVEEIFISPLTKSWLRP